MIQCSPNLFYACADSSEWGLFGRCARSAFHRTPSGRVTRSQLESDLIQPQKAQRSPTDLLWWSRSQHRISCKLRGNT